MASTTSATFITTVNPDGLSTTVHFEYGRPGDPVSVTTDQPVGSDRTNHTITIGVTGLLPNSLYHVRAVATNGAGVAPGNDQVFQTPADQPPRRRCWARRSTWP